MNDCQTGFRQNIGSEVNILRLIETTRDRLQQLKAHPQGPKLLFTFFIDFKSAFDRVKHVELFRKLKKYVDEPLLNTIRWLYQQTQIYDGKKAYNIR